MPAETGKRYYAIGEVAEKFSVTTSLLRHWETEFPALQPKKNKKGDRRYTERDIETVRTIYQLVKEKGYTLHGARESIKAKANQPPDKATLIESLEDLKAFLVQLRDKLTGSQ